MELDGTAPQLLVLRGHERGEKVQIFILKYRDRSTLYLAHKNAAVLRTSLEPLPENPDLSICDL